MKLSMRYILVFSVFILWTTGCQTPADSSPADTLETVAKDDGQKSADSAPKDAATEKPSAEPNFSIPDGYILFGKEQGDLNKDGLDDYVLVIKGTNEENLVLNQFDEKVDRNRRGILIYLSGDGGFDLASKNLDCFSSENEDGGVYFPPELSVGIKNGNLFFHYAHGRYGYWKYTFRYQNAGFELIGYDLSESNGPVVDLETSINFLTKKKLVKENTSPDAESGSEVFKETWEDVEISQLLKLSKIKDFDSLDVM